MRDDVVLVLKEHKHTPLQALWFRGCVVIGSPEGTILTSIPPTLLIATAGYGHGYGCTSPYWQLGAESTPVP